MTRRFSLLLLSMLAPLALAQDLVPEAIQPQEGQWFSPPNVPGLKATWILGSEPQPGLYLLRVKLASGTRLPPHSHPDTRHTTVLSGTLYVGFGEQFDEQRLVAIPAGAVYIAPADKPHYLWAKEGDVVYQEGGDGPTGTGFTTTP